MKTLSTPDPCLYVALLRGINVGGNKKVPMKDLKTTVESLKGKNVVTLLASGNVLFYSGENSETLAPDLSMALRRRFGFDIPVQVFRYSDIAHCVKNNPFGQEENNPSLRLYVSFKNSKSKTGLTLPYLSGDGSFAILAAEGNFIYSKLDLAKSKTPDAMNILEKEFGKNITTRNLNTVIKIVDEGEKLLAVKTGKRKK